MQGLSATAVPGDRRWTVTGSISLSVERSGSDWVASGDENLVLTAGDGRWSVSGGASRLTATERDGDWLISGDGCALTASPSGSHWILNGHAEGEQAGFAASPSPGGGAWVISGSGSSQALAVAVLVPTVIAARIARA